MYTETTRKLQFFRAFNTRSFLFVWLGQTISAIGDAASTIALAWLVLTLTNSTFAMSIVIVAQVVPTSMLILFGGVAADRLPRRVIMFWSDGGRAIVTFAIVVLGYMHLLQYWHLTILAVLFGIVDSFFSPAYRSLIPELVPADDLSSANALTSLSQQTSKLIGLASGTAWVAFVGATNAFAFDAATFIFSALCLFIIRQPSLTKTLLEKAPDELLPRQNRFRIVLSDVREGWQYIKSSQWLWVTILIASVANIGFFGSMAVLLPKLVQNRYSEVWVYGFITAMNALGAIITPLIIGNIKKIVRRGLLAYLAIIASSIGLIMIGLPLNGIPGIILAGVGSIVAGAALGLFGVLWVTILQELVPLDKLGRVSSLDLLGSYALIPVGFLLIGGLAEQIDPAWLFIAGGIVNILLSCIALSVRSIRQLA